MESSFFSFVKTEACDPEMPVLGLVGKEKSLPLSHPEGLDLVDAASNLFKNSSGDVFCSLAILSAYLA